MDQTTVRKQGGIRCLNLLTALLSINYNQINQNELTCLFVSSNDQFSNLQADNIVDVRPSDFLLMLIQILIFVLYRQPKPEPPALPFNRKKP